MGKKKVRSRASLNFRGKKHRRAPESRTLTARCSAHEMRSRATVRLRALLQLFVQRLSLRRGRAEMLWIDSRTVSHSNGRLLKRLRCVAR